MIGVCLSVHWGRGTPDQDKGTLPLLPSLPFSSLPSLTRTEVPLPPLSPGKTKYPSFPHSNSPFLPRPGQGCPSVPSLPPSYWQDKDTPRSHSPSSRPDRDAHPGPVSPPPPRARMVVWHGRCAFSTYAGLSCLFNFLDISLTFLIFGLKIVHICVFATGWLMRKPDKMVDDMHAFFQSVCLELPGYFRILHHKNIVHDKMARD